MTRPFIAEWPVYALLLLLLGVACVLYGQSLSKPKTFEFTLVIKADRILRPDQVDALYANGCDDGTVAYHDGMNYVTFAREAKSLEDAINSAILDIAKAGFASRLYE
jgi:hypothetical protein